MELLNYSSFVVADPRLDSVDGPDPVPVGHVGRTATEEALVVDARAGVRPAQMVERKLASLLKSQPLSISHRMSQRTSRNP